MNRSKKLFLFLGLDVKPLKDVVFKPTTNILSVGDITCQQLRQMFAYLDWAQEGIYIEAIPEQLSDYEHNRNVLKIAGVL